MPAQQIERWRITRNEINTTVNGLEWVVLHCISSLRLLSASFWLPQPWLKITDKRDPFTEAYVLFVFLILSVILFCSERIAIWQLIIVTYILCELLVTLSAILLLRKLPSAGPLVSIERSLILLLVNAAEITVAFAIFYRHLLSLSPIEALFGSVKVFATIGTPEINNEEWKHVFIAQVACNFLFLAVFVTAYVGNLRGFKGHDP
jgi:hypothetical protein